MFSEIVCWYVGGGTYRKDQLQTKPLNTSNQHTREQPEPRFQNILHGWIAIEEYELHREVTRKMMNITTMQKNNTN